MFSLLLSLFVTSALAQDVVFFDISKNAPKTPQGKVIEEYVTHTRLIGATSFGINRAFVTDKETDPKAESYQKSLTKHRDFYTKQMDEMNQALLKAKPLFPCDLKKLPRIPHVKFVIEDHTREQDIKRKQSYLKKSKTFVALESFPFTSGKPLVTFEETPSDVKLPKDSLVYGFDVDIQIENPIFDLSGHEFFKSSKHFQKMRFNYFMTNLMTAPSREALEIILATDLFKNEEASKAMLEKALEKAKKIPLNNISELEQEAGKIAKALPRKDVLGFIDMSDEFWANYVQALEKEKSLKMISKDVKGVPGEFFRGLVKHSLSIDYWDSADLANMKGSFYHHIVLTDLRNHPMSYSLGELVCLAGEKKEDLYILTGANHLGGLAHLLQLGAGEVVLPLWTTFNEKVQLQGMKDDLELMLFIHSRGKHGKVP